MAVLNGIDSRLEFECRAARNGEAAEGEPFALETSVDLAGHVSPERLVVEPRTVRVLGGEGFQEERRRWDRSRIEGFRVEPATGSCFLQARIDGQWTDVLRYPGNSDRWLSGKERGKPHARHWRTARRLWGMVRPFRGSVLLLLGLSAAVVAIEVVPPMLLKMLVDVLDAKVPKGQAGQLLILLAAIVGGLLLVRLTATLGSIWKGYVSSRLGTTLTANLRNDLVRKLIDLPLAFHDRNQVGMLMSRVAYDTETLHTLAYHITGGFLLQSFQLVAIGVALFYLNSKLALVTMLPMPLIIAASWYFTRYLNPRNQHYWDAVGKQASALTGMLSGIRVVKAFTQERREIERFSESSIRLRDSRQTVDASAAVFTALMGFLFALGTLAVWYIGGYDVLFGQMTLGSLVAFLAYLAMFYTPLTSISESTTWFSNFFTAIRRIFDLLDRPGEATESNEETASPRSERRVEGRIEFQGVSFGYDKSRPVLEDISFAIEPGEMIGIVGRSGSGKSTLVSLIGRLYEIDSGRLLIDGADVRAMNARQLRRSIGMVPQEPFLFRGSVAENIAYGNADATPEEILRAAKYADSHDFIMRMTFGYEAQLGEGGLGLSGGERQRLSIARALLFDPAILILDEATANIDAESERAICDAIRRFSRRRTTIVIAHRLSTLRDADRLLVFDQGKLIEQGRPEDLLERGGLYSSLVRLQGSLNENRRRMETVLGARMSRQPGAGLIETGEEQGFLHSLPLNDGEDCSVHSSAPRTETLRDDCGLDWLAPDRTEIAADGQGHLRVTREGQDVCGIHAVAAFPASCRRRFLSVRQREPSGREVEVGMLRALDDWPRTAQEAVEGSLGRRYLLRHIREIRQVRTGGSQLALVVLTDGGQVRLELDRSGEGVQRFGKDGLLLNAQGSYYVIGDRKTLPRRQQRLLALYFGD